MAIHVLDKHTAELIAAGEVVERPSSVVKELCENSIDAGAKHLTVEIERGGTALIEIQDDGHGIEAADIPLAFLRHATSKVRTERDLDSIATLGFRGEALASIASVARVELLTRTEEDEFASLYRIEGGEELGIEAAARPIGTTITVRDIFYNVPARMKFLKKDASEASFVTETVSRLALSHPEVSVRYIRDGKQVFLTPGDGDLKSAAWSVLGAEFARELTAVEGGVAQYSVKGYVTPPRACRASRSMQFFFINGRFVKNRTMMAALEQAYRGMLMVGKFPGGVLALAMPPELVDVNVHPAKTEVRFAREKDVFDAVYQSVKAALLQASAAHSQFCLGDEEKKTEVPQPKAAPTVETKAATAPPAGGVKLGGFVYKAQVPPAEPVPVNVMPADTGGDVVELRSDASFAPYTASRPVAPPPVFAERALDIEPEPAEEPVEERVQVADMPTPEQTSLLLEEEEPLRFVGELFRTYILAQKGDTLCVLDKHAAHERMIFEQLMAARQSPDTQQLLSPVTVLLSADEKTAILQNAAAVEAAGLEVEDFGGNAVVVRGVPADVEPSNVGDLIVEIARRLATGSRDTLDEKTEWVLHSVSCRAAMKAGDKTAPQDLLKLAADIMEGRIPPFCPHGRPVVLEITRGELEKQFGRLG